MLITVLQICLGLLAIIFALILIVPAKTGRIVYALTTALESRVYGLKRIWVDIAEMRISLYTNTLSDRPTIIMLHGFSADKVVWIRFARHFTADFNVLIPDLAGHGETGYEESWDYTMPAQAKRVAQIIEQLGIEKVHIIGNSMGGFISAHFARTYPHLTLSVGLVDPAGVSSPEPSDMEIMLEHGRNPFVVNNRQEFDEFYAMTMARPPYVPGFVRQFICEEYQLRREQLIHVFAGFREQDFLDLLLEQIRTPLLLLWGEEDRLIHVSSVAVWQSGIEDIQVKTWPGIGHMPMLEIPRQSAGVYRQFLARHYSI